MKSKYKIEINVCECAGASDMKHGNVFNSLDEAHGVAQLLRTSRKVMCEEIEQKRAWKHATVKDGWK